MHASLLKAACLALWLCAPAFAESKTDSDTGRGSSLPQSESTSQQSMGTEGSSSRSGSGSGMSGSRSSRSGSSSSSSGVDTRSDRDTFREAPAATPATPRVAPGREPYRAPGSMRPEATTPNETTHPETGRRWGLIVFVVALVGLGLLAFRRRRPLPPAP